MLDGRKWREEARKASDFNIAGGKAGGNDHGVVVG